MNQNVNRDIPLPLYYQIKNILKESITDGSYKPGDTIPTESELINTYQVSRATIRQAINSLVNEGYLYRERAKGTFVKCPPIERKFLGNLRCFSEEMSRKDIPHGTQVLEKTIEIPSPILREKLQLDYGDQVFKLKRLRTVDNNPVLIVHSYIPYNFFIGIEKIDFNENSLYNTLEGKYGIKLSHGQRIIEPKIVDSEETMRLLKIEPGTCISYIESVIFDSNNQPIEFLKAELLGKISIDIY